MKLFFKFLFILICFFSAIKLSAQSGGPPMITDDPGVVDLHKFEINTSANPTIYRHQQNELALPYVDANYGIAKRLQLKAEFPFLLNYGNNTSSSYQFGYLLLGLKIRIFDEGKYFMSVGTYPQWTATGTEKGFLLPLLFEKTYGKFLIGEDIGMFWGYNGNQIFNNGILLGYKVSKKFEAMSEYYLEKELNYNTGTDGFFNVGFRYALSSHINLMGSFGTQLVTSAGNDRQQFFSWMGIQTDF